MQTLFIGFVEDAVNPMQKGIAIRMAYLLSARLRIAGTIPNYYSLSQDLRTISFEQKIKFIDDNMKDEPDNVQLYQQYKDFNKVYKKNRGNQKEFIVAKNKLEKNVNGMYNIMLDSFERMIQSAGLVDFRPAEKSATYAEYYIVYRDAENANNEFNTLSEILTLNLVDEDKINPTVFILSDMFLSDKFIAEENAMPSLNTFSEKGFLQELFTFPNYSNFSVADLNTLRFELKESLEHFQIVVNTFAALNANPVDVFNYLQNDVVTAAKTLTAHTNNTQTVASYKKLNTATFNAGKLYLGMIPLHLVFKYFEFIKASQQETIAILNQYPEDERNKFVPVFIVTFNTETPAEETTGITNAQLLPLKKTLSID